MRYCFWRERRKIAEAPMKRLRIAPLAIGLAIVCLAVANGLALQTAPGQQSRPSPSAAPPAQRADVAPTLSTEANQTVNTYCLTCHNDKVKRGELSLASFDIARIAEHVEVGEKMVRKLRLGMMPPKEASRKPDAATRLALASALESALDAAAVKANPGRRSFQRLNRAEYAAA